MLGAGRGRVRRVGYNRYMHVCSAGCQNAAGVYRKATGSKLGWPGPNFDSQNGGAGTASTMVL